MSRAAIFRAAVVSGATIASVAAYRNMTDLPGLIVIAPGYLVQAWLFERHLALGGAGYTATLVGVSVIFWSVLVLGLAAIVRRLGRLLARRAP